MFKIRVMRGASALVLATVIGGTAAINISSAAYADTGAASGGAGGGTSASGSGSTSTASEGAGSTSGASSTGDNSAKAGNVSVSVGSANTGGVSLSVAAASQAGAASGNKGLVAGASAGTAGQVAGTQTGGFVAAVAVSTPQKRTAAAVGSAGQSALAVSGKTITVSTYVPNGQTQTFHKLGGEVSVSYDNAGVFSFAFANGWTAKAGVGQGSTMSFNNAGLMGMIQHSLYAEAGADRFSAYAMSSASIGGSGHSSEASVAGFGYAYSFARVARQFQIAGPSSCSETTVWKKHKKVGVIERCTVPVVNQAKLSTSCHGFFLFCSSSKPVHRTAVTAHTKKITVQVALLDQPKSHKRKRIHSLFG